MSDSDSSPGQPGIPDWQKTQQSDDNESLNSTEPAPTPSSSASEVDDAPAAETPAEETREAASESSSEDSLTVARRFLDNDAVRHAPHDKKVAFLKSKGIDDADIEALLAHDEPSSSPETDSGSDTSDSRSSYVPTPTETLSPSPSSQPPPVDRPPIVTYPEFLAKSPRPPPLVTTDRLLNALYAITGLSTLVYGASRYIVHPMVDHQAEARTEFHDLTSRKMDALVAKLEKSVSEVPPKKPVAGAADAEDSDAEDPTEMFHRDMGTQTTFPISSVTALTDSNGAKGSSAKHNATQLASLNKTLSGLKDEYRSQSEGMDEIKTAIDVLRDDLDSLTFTGQSMIGSYDLYGRTRKNEPDDEIRKVRDNIRRVKGVLLSTRNFPATAR